MDIEITQLEGEALFPYSHSRAEGGQNAGKRTWDSAMRAARKIRFLVTDEQREEFRDYVREFGPWDDKEIDGWSDQECEALFLQMVAGDARNVGIEDLADFENDEDGQNWKCPEIFRSDDGALYYSIGI